MGERWNPETDYAETWRRDLHQIGGVVLEAAKRHLVILRLLPKETPDRDKAIADMERFMKEHADG